MRKIGQLLLIALLTAALTSCTNSSGGGDDTGTPDGGGQTDVDPPDGDGDQNPVDTLQPDTIDTTDPDTKDAVEPDGLDSVDPDGTDVDLPDQIQPDGTDTVAPDGTDAVEDIGPPPETFYPTAELGLRILGPDAQGWGQVLGGALSVTGVAMGQPDVIFWETDQGLSGYADGLPFWKTSKIDLVPGDNTITVTAQKGQETVTDTLILSYNPAFLFGGKLRIRPGGLFVGQSSTLVFTLSMGLYLNFEPSTLKLCECTQDGECVSDVHTMMDDGQVGTSGDEVGGDGVFSWKKTYSLDAPGRICFRAHSLVTAGYQQYTAFSPVRCVEVVDHFTPAQCEEVKALHQEAKTLYDATLANTSDPAASRQAVVDLLAGTEGVDQVGMASDGGYGVWVRYINGVLGVLNFSPAGMRGAGDSDEEYETIDAPIIGDNEIKIDSKRSTVFAPYAAEFGASDEAVFINNLLDKSECPPYIIDGPYNDNQATLMRLQRQRDYGVIALTSHGDAYFEDLSPAVKQAYGWHHGGSQEVLWTGEDLNCNNLYQGSQTCNSSGSCPAGSECIITQSSGTSSSISGICVDLKQIDVMRGRVALGINRYAILPAHIKHHQGVGYPKSMVYLGACRSLWNGSLAMEYFAAGAKAIAGYTGYVASSYAYEQGAQLFAAMIEEKKLSAIAMPNPAVEDDENPGSKLMMLGASNLNVYDAEIINPSWETGELTGWFKDGDGRVVSKLGITAPVEGKFMSLISTGMGYTVQTGEIYQDFCIPADKVEASFYWKFYSEEFKEWCGSSFQDTFQATLEAEIGQITMVDTWVDALCPPGECYNCGSQFVGLFESDVEFDVGGVWNTMWQKSLNNVMALAGQGPVTLRFFSSDAGDSIYDTVILIDTVKFK
ncbi:MAG: hypothetical protein ABIK09_15670 [Pseudomonadota bacterium]